MKELARLLRPWLVLTGGVLLVAILYLAQGVLMPVALAALLTFLLSPLVTWLQGRIGRVPSVVVVVLAACVVFGLAGWGLTQQLTALADELPGYRENIRRKIADIKGAGSSGPLEKAQQVVRDIEAELQRRQGPPAAVIQAQKPADLWPFVGAAAPVLGGLATAGLVVVMVIFMLLEREHLRNRVVGVLGRGRLAATTRALDEAAERVTRYLTRQSLINGLFGLGVGLGLSLIGVPHALLWGLLAALLRFIPYVGPWVAAVGPTLLGLAVFPGWWRPVAVAALFLALELVANMVLETLLYADAAGVSEVGLLVAVAFWAWLWGPIGLLLATPLTVCLVVAGKHLPGLGILVTLLGDRPPLTPDVALYQRLLAEDHDEAADIVEAALAGPAPDDVYDEVIVPALVHARSDRAEGRITAREERSVVRGVARVLDDLSAGQPAAGAGPGAARPLVVVGCAASGEADAVSLRMLRQLLDPTGIDLEVEPPGRLSSELVERVLARAPAAVCIAALPPGGLAHARYLALKLRAAVPHLMILLGRWGSRTVEAEVTALQAAGVEAVASRLAEMRDRLRAALPTLRARLEHAAAG